jgi:hypothetical protein
MGLGLETVMLLIEHCDNLIALGMCRFLYIGIYILRATVWMKIFMQLQISVHSMPTLSRNQFKTNICFWIVCKI